VKLGTITPKGADVFSYHPSEDDLVRAACSGHSGGCVYDRRVVDARVVPLQVENPSLATHLANLGINMMVMEKTEKSMAELNIDINNRCAGAAPALSPRVSSCLLTPASALWRAAASSGTRSWSRAARAS
jgi:hypothetical protein